MLIKIIGLSVCLVIGALSAWGSETGGDEVLTLEEIRAAYEEAHPKVLNVDITGVYSDFIYDYDTVPEGEKKALYREHWFHFVFDYGEEKQYRAEYEFLDGEPAVPYRLVRADDGLVGTLLDCPENVSGEVQ
jgi:hypothetical protein